MGYLQSSAGGPQPTLHAICQEEFCDGSAGSGGDWGDLVQGWGDGGN